MWISGGAGWCLLFAMAWAVLMAVQTLKERFFQGRIPRHRDAFARRIVQSIQYAGHCIYQEANEDHSRHGMGTTATVAGLIDKVLFVGQIGDSRAYVLRRGRLKQITKDQTLVNQLLESGQLTEEELEDFGHSNIILQALGTTEEIKVDLTFLELRRGDRLMLCSDGLSGLVHDEVIKYILTTHRDLKQCSEKLISLANAAGGYDNITIAIADFDGEELEMPDEQIPVMYQQYPLPVDVEDDEPVTSKAVRLKSIPIEASSAPLMHEFRSAESSDKDAAGWWFPGNF